MGNYHGSRGVSPWSISVCKLKIELQMPRYRCVPVKSRVSFSISANLCFTCTPRVNKVASLHHFWGKKKHLLKRKCNHRVKQDLGMSEPQVMLKKWKVWISKEKNKKKRKNNSLSYRSSLICSSVPFLCPCKLALKPSWCWLKLGTILVTKQHVKFSWKVVCLFQRDSKPNVKLEGEEWWIVVSICEVCSKKKVTKNNMETKQDIYILKH